MIKPQYITKDKLLEEVRNYAREILEIDKKMALEILNKEKEISNDTLSSKSAREYSLNLLGKVGGKQDQLRKAHYIQASAIDISSKLMRYADQMENINNRYHVQLETFKEQLNLGKIAELEKREMDKIKDLVSSIEKIAEDLPSFDDLEVRLVRA